MKRKAISMVLAMMMGTMALAGCGNDKKVESSKGNDKATEATSDASDEGKVFNISCWNEEFKTRLEDYYPGYEKVDATTGKIGDVTVNWKITPSDDNAYQNALDEALLAQADAAADDKVDMFLVEADYALKYIDTEYALDVNNDIGVSEDSLKDQYQYTKDIVTDSNGNLKGVSWQGCPGTMIYRRDVAKEVFGTDDPEKIQEKFNDWDSFLAAAEELKGAGYQITCSANDTYRVFSNNVTSKWVVDGKVNIDENIMKWVEMTKDMVDKGYTGTYDLWGADWQKGFTTEGNVFCYFGPAWFVDFTLGGHDLDGQWAATVGPQGFYWGGSWICGAAGTDNVSLIKDIMEKLTCDADIMVDIVKGKKDFVNNKPAMNDMAKDSTYGNDVLGGQNPLAMYCEGADKISLDNLTAYDAGCNEELQKALKDYYEGKTTLDEALDVFYKNVTTKYPDLTH